MCCFVYISFTKWSLSNLCVVLFISPSQNIKQPSQNVLFCLYLLHKILSNLLHKISSPFVYISFTKYSATFVLFCLYLLHKILSNLHVLFCLYLLHKILSSFCIYLLHKIFSSFCLYLLHKMLSSFCLYLLCVVLFISPSQNIKQSPCVVLFISPSQNVKQPFVLFCLYLLHKILSNLCVVLFISPFG